MNENEHKYATINYTALSTINIREKCHPTIAMYAHDKWMFKLSPEGIFFNREEFPKFSADDFAIEFMNILEKCFEVSFNRKFDSEKGYLRNEVTATPSDLPNGT